MSVIIRLQNLPWSANALDIRQFFHGLSIPEGGVHIVGGEQGDAFIAFSTDEDARQAFARNNGKIKEVQISLMLSSRTEMQKVIEAARAQSFAAFMQNATPTTQAQPQTTLPAAIPPLMPAAVPDFNKQENNKERDNKNDKRDRRRSRSKSRERKDRDRRDRRYRDKSRSRSRERRERRRRDRSRSRGRSRSRDRDRRSRDRKRSPDKKTEIWCNQNSNDGSVLMTQQQQQPPSLLANFAGNLDDARRNLGALNMPLNRNNFQNNFGENNRGWPMMGAENNQNFLLNRPDNNLLNSRQLGGVNQNQAYQPNRRYPTPRGFQKNDEQYSPNSERSDRDSLPNTCVKLQPFFGGYGEIRRFFQGIFISNVGIKFINDDYGHRTGIVYIQFGHPQGKADALQKSGEALNGLKVEISHLDDQEFEDAVDRYQPDQNSDDKKFRNNKTGGKFYGKTEEPKVFSCLIVDDLPTYVKEQDILKMFSTRPLISLILTSKPRGGRIAYVKFGSTDEAKKALEEQSNHIVEGKPVTVRPCHDSEFETVNEQHDVDLDRKPSNFDTDCLNLTRLPLQTNNIEITDFFSDIGVRPTKIHLMSNRLGFTGQAFCEFKTCEEANRALKKDNASFGPNIVSVQPISRDEMEHILQQSQMTNPQQQQQHNQPRPMSLMAQPTRPPFYPRNTYDNNRGMASNMNPMSRFMGHRPLIRPRYNMNMNNHEQDPPGCTVYMDNVPYKAGTNEILEFFDGYDITNNVSRRYNPNNTPSAEAKVVFTSPEEAYRAVQERHGQKIWDRPIYLKQV